MLVMRTAQQPDPAGFVSTSSREAVAVIEFERPSLGTPAAMLVRESAATAVPLEDRAVDRVRNVTRTRVARLSRCLLSRRAPFGEAVLLHSLEEDLEPRFDDRSDVPVGYATPQEILGLPEHVATGATRGELELEGVFGERRNHGPIFIAGEYRSCRV
ncbi:MAG: hypothetical protein ACJ79H_05120, partial [Myxococcales bacterium]